MKTNLLVLFLGISFLYACNKENYYSVDDFYATEKIDAHYHIYTGNNNTLEQAGRDNFQLLNINTYTDGCEKLVEAHQELVKLNRTYHNAAEFSASFCLEVGMNPDVDNTIAWLDGCIADGAVAVKVWKNIGMEFRDKEDNLVMIDHPQFEPVFKHLEAHGIPLVAHLGEPKNCWLPLDEMTVKNDSGYFSRNPQYHMYLHPELPSYEEQIAARDRMLQKHPDLTFIGCHLASLEWSVDQMAAFLDRFPNASMDMAARMGQLFYQTAEHRDKVRAFFIRYQDRLIYGTDIIDSGGHKEAFEEKLHQTWMKDWEYLVADNEMTSRLINKPFRGLKLPKEVVDKIYYTNAITWYRL